MVLDAHILLATKTTTNEHAMTMHFLCWELKHRTDLMLFIIDGLTGSMYKYTFITFRQTNCTLWFHECMFGVWCFVSACDDMRAFLECFLYISAVDVLQ